MDVVFFSLFRADNPYSSISLSMAKELAKHHRVIYVNHPYSVRDMWRGLRDGDRDMVARLPRFFTGRVRYEHLAAIPNNFVSVIPPLLLPINWLPPGSIYKFFHRINNALILHTIRRALRDHQVNNFIYINCFDMIYARVLPKKMGAQLSIYHCIDDITDDHYLGKHSIESENEAIRKADLTFVTSTNLYKLKRPLSDRVVTYFNAADVENFRQVRTQTYPRPKELDGRKGQVIGFVGNLDSYRIDYELLKKVALAYPDKTLLLVGPVNSTEPKEIGLDKLPNVVFAGSRRLQDLPLLMQYMDCVLIPFRYNRVTQSIYPLKINEYLAAGKPVVSTSFSDDIRSFADCIYLAEKHEQFVERIADALAEQDPALVQCRADVADSNTWEARIAQLWDIVSSKLERSKFERSKVHNLYAAEPTNLEPHTTDAKH